MGGGHPPVGLQCWVDVVQQQLLAFEELAKVVCAQAHVRPQLVHCGGGAARRSVMRVQDWILKCPSSRCLCGDTLLLVGEQADLGG